MPIGVLAESGELENRVSVTPTGVAKLIAGGREVLVETGAGTRAGFDDDRYRQAGAVVADRTAVFAQADFVVGVHGPPSTRPLPSRWDSLGPDHTLIALLDPLWRPDRAADLAETGATLVSLELVPRITRAQSMDVLSSMATVTGYGAVLLAASRSAKMFPLLMTAAGTVPAARVVILGAGVAGLAAIAYARKLGAIVSAYDIRPAATEQIRSLGAKAIELDLESDNVEDAGGYATEQGADTAGRQQQALAPHIAEADIVITTASIPGAASPELITTPMVEAMAPGSVIVDLAAERGGNCRLSQPDGEVIHGGVIICGPTDLASRSAESASLMFSNNVVALIDHLSADDGRPTLDVNDEITAGTVIATGGRVVHPRLRERLGLPEANGFVDRGADHVTDQGTEPTSESKR